MQLDLLGLRAGDPMGVVGFGWGEGFCGGWLRGAGRMGGGRRGGYPGGWVGYPGG